MLQSQQEDGRVQVAGARPSTASPDDSLVLRIMRERLRQDPPEVQFAPQAKRYLGLFH